MSHHLDRAPSAHPSPRAVNYREVAESVGAIALEHVASGADSNAALWAHARAAAHFARLHLTTAASE